jgi:hypothetical protein
MIIAASQDGLVSTPRLIAIAQVHDLHCDRGNVSVWAIRDSFEPTASPTTSGMPRWRRNFALRHNFAMCPEAKCTEICFLFLHGQPMKLPEILMRTSRNLRRHEGSVGFSTVECARKSFLGLGDCEIRQATISLVG